jgi:hypothetical protein
MIISFSIKAREAHVNFLLNKWCPHLVLLSRKKSISRKKERSSEIDSVRAALPAEQPI